MNEIAATWGVVTFFVVSGAIFGIAIFWGKSDRTLSRYMPSISGLFTLGRIRAGREFPDENEDDNSKQ